MPKFITKISATALAISLAGVLAALGCGTTRTSNTARTATEQLLISDAIDRTVQSIDFSVLSGKTVFFDERHLLEVVDKGYLISSLRQHLLASGCVLKETRDLAEFVVEPRVGAVGTDNHDLLFGVPALQVPQVALAPALPAAIPEIPFAKRRDQRGVAKVAVFAYRRDTGEPVWQSGMALSESTANDIWVFGAGPFKRGTIYDAIRLAKGRSKDDAIVREYGPSRVASLKEEAIFANAKPATRTAAPQLSTTDNQVIPASAEQPITPTPATPAAESQPPKEAPPDAAARPLSEAPPG